MPLSSVTAVTPSTLGRPAGGSPFEAALDGGAPLTGRLRSTPRTYSEAGDLSPRPRMCTMWQEVEEDLLLSGRTWQPTSSEQFIICICIWFLSTVVHTDWKCRSRSN